jgi:hypothetical protein
MGYILSFGLETQRPLFGGTFQWRIQKIRKEGRSGEGGGAPLKNSKQLRYLGSETLCFTNITW